MEKKKGELFEVSKKEERSKAKARDSIDVYQRVYSYSAYNNRC